MTDDKVHLNFLQCCKGKPFHIWMKESYCWLYNCLLVQDVNSVGRKRIQWTIVHELVDAFGQRKVNTLVISAWWTLLWTHYFCSVWMALSHIGHSAPWSSGTMSTLTLASCGFGPRPDHMKDCRHDAHYLGIGQLHHPVSGVSPRQTGTLSITNRNSKFPSRTHAFERLGNCFKRNAAMV